MHHCLPIKESEPWGGMRYTGKFLHVDGMGHATEDRNTIDTLLSPNPDSSLLAVGSEGISSHGLDPSYYFFLGSISQLLPSYCNVIQRKAYIFQRRQWRQFGSYITFLLLFCRVLANTNACRQSVLPMLGDLSTSSPPVPLVAFLPFLPYSIIRYFIISLPSTDRPREDRQSRRRRDRLPPASRDKGHDFIFVIISSFSSPAICMSLMSSNTRLYSIFCSRKLLSVSSSR